VDILATIFSWIKKIDLSSNVASHSGFHGSIYAWLIYGLRRGVMCMHAYYNESISCIYFHDYPFCN